MNDTMEATSRPAKHVVYWMEDLFKKNNVDEVSQCGEGCSYCCHLIISISIFDAVNIAKGIEKLKDNERAICRAKAKINIQVNDKAKTDGDRWKERLPCPFLKENKCSVYNHRPIGCRATISQNRDSCISQFKDSNSEYHRVLGPRIDGFTPEAIDIYQLIAAYQVDSETAVMPCKDVDQLTNIDLDRFIYFYCVPDKLVRKRLLKKMATYNRQVLKKLQKRTEPPRPTKEDIDILNTII